MLRFLRHLFRPSDPLEAQLQERLELPIYFRPYRDDDLEACITLFRENQTELPGDGGWDFIDFLSGKDSTIIVATLNNKIIACGGIVWSNSDVSVLCYGIVSPKYKGYRVGTTLTLLRIAQLPSNPDGHYVVIFALEYSMLFYSRFGFVEVAEWKPEDGSVHPVGVMHVSDASLDKVKSTLAGRGIKVDGDIVIHTRPEASINVTRSASGRFQIRFRTPTQGESQ